MVFAIIGKIQVSWIIDILNSTNPNYITQEWGTCGLQNHKVQPSEPVVKNAKFCKEYEIYENYNSEVPFEISNHRFAH